MEEYTINRGKDETEIKVSVVVITFNHGNISDRP